MAKKKEDPVETLMRVSGGTSNIAAALGVSRQFVRVCINRGWFPAVRAKILEKRYGVPRQQLMNPELLELLN